MSMETTEKGIKKFSKEEKQKILEEAQSNGIKVTLAKYDCFGPQRNQTKITKKNL